MATNAKRIEVNAEGRYTFLNDRLDKILDEIDARLSSGNCYSDVTRFVSGTDEGLIDKIIIYSDIARTIKMIERDFSYTNGRITGIVDTYFNVDQSPDSLVTAVITRDVEGLITGCDSTFSTTEDQGC